MDLGLTSHCRFAGAAGLLFLDTAEAPNLQKAADFGRL